MFTTGLLTTEGEEEGVDAGAGAGEVAGEDEEGV